MIIKQTRIRSGGGSKALAHVLNVEDNESVDIIFGDEGIVAEAEASAKAEGHKFSLRHFVISPDQHLTPEQTVRAVRALREEFAWADRPFLLVQHIKPRADGSQVPHLHILVPEADLEGRVMDSRFSKVRNEKVARLLEIEFGHQITRGRHMRAVEAAFRREGHHHAADALASQRPSERPRAAFSSNAHQKCKRLDVDLPKIVEFLKPAKDADLQAKATRLAEAATKFDIEIRPVTDHRGRRSLKAFSRDGQELLSLNRAIGAKARDVPAIANLIAARKDENHDITQEIQQPTPAKRTLAAGLFAGVNPPSIRPFEGHRRGSSTASRPVIEDGIKDAKNRKGGPEIQSAHSATGRPDSSRLGRTEPNREGAGPIQPSIGGRDPLPDTGGHARQFGATPENRTTASSDYSAQALIEGARTVSANRVLNAAANPTIRRLASVLGDFVRTSPPPGSTLPSNATHEQIAAFFQKVSAALNAQHQAAEEAAMAMRVPRL